VVHAPAGSRLDDSARCAPNSRNDPSFDFPGLIRELNKADGLTFQYVIIGADGYMVMSSVATPGAVVNLRGREHFAFIKLRMRIACSSAKPILGKVTGKWTIQFDPNAITNHDGKPLAA